MTRVIQHNPISWRLRELLTLQPAVKQNVWFRDEKLFEKKKWIELNWYTVYLKPFHGNKEITCCCAGFFMLLESQWSFYNHNERNWGGHWVIMNKWLHWVMRPPVFAHGTKESFSHCSCINQNLHCFKEKKHQIESHQIYLSFFS